MSLWRRLFGRGGKPETTREASPPGPDRPPPGPDRPPTGRETPPPGAVAPGAPPSPEDDERETLRRLRHVGRPGGMDVAEALLLLRQHHGRATQTPILDALVAAITATPGRDDALDPIRVACATLLDERGDRRRALELVEPSRSVAAMMLAAELYAQEGNLPRAVGMVERVLARSIDTPGARERHERWCAQLGRRPREGIVSDGATVVAPAAATSTSFRILREVARGGAGTVYLAEDTLLGRRLAYKVYHRGREEQAQIEREARLAVTLAGPGVIRIFDASPEEGWIATEWVERGSLREVLRAGRVRELLPLGGWLVPLVHAVGRVHDEGLVHGDIKPANVLLRAPDDPLLSDFGICQPSGAPQTAGTRGYLSPERLEGAPADPRDDVYALGRVLDDVIAAADEAEAASPDGRHLASVALACLAPAATRPPHARAVLALLRGQ